MENRMEVSHKIKIELPNDTAIPLLDIHAKEMKSATQRDTYTPIFTAALFVIVEMCNQLEYPSRDE